MSLPKAQLVDPQGNMNVPGMNATGVVTATSLDGVSTGSVTNLTGNPDLDVGIVTGTSFIGEGTGHAAGLSGTPELNLGVTTATSFVGDAVGKAAGLTGTPNLNVGLVTATGFTADVDGNVTGNVSGNLTGNIVGDVTGNITGDVTGNITGNIQGDVEGDVVGNVSGYVTGLASSIKPGVNLGVGVCTALEYYGDGSTLTGVASSSFVAQEITATGSETIIDLSYGNIIYYTGNADTTVGFASTATAEKVSFIRTVTDYDITWPSNIYWAPYTGISSTNKPALHTTSAITNGVQTFNLTTNDGGLTWYGSERVDTTQGGMLFKVGGNDKGEFGNNEYVPGKYFSSPVQVMADKAWRTVQSNNPGGVIMGVTYGGELWGWAANDYGMLGLNQGPGIQYSSPVQVGSNTNWKDINVNYHNCIGLKDDNTLWAWGRNQGGELGQNQALAQLAAVSSPTQIPGVWLKLAVSGDWAGGDGKGYFAFKNQDSLWAWGSNQGILGLNDTQAYSSPTQVPGTWSMVSATSQFEARAIKTNGTAWAWGYGGAGELGQNDRTTRSSPIQIGTNDNWATFGGSGRSMIATKTDGTAWSWGDNWQGSLGQNNNTRYSSPTRIGNPGEDYPDGGWRTALPGGMGGGSNALIRKNGTLWSFGYNGGRGQLGHNNLTSYSSPKQLPGIWGYTATPGILLRFENVNAGITSGTPPQP